MAIVYRHRRLDTFQVFYVGVGSNKKRAYEKFGRNNLWKKVVEKAGYIVEIIAEGISKEEALELEILLISIYGRKNLETGILANLTDGGEGSNNMSEESRKKISEAITIRNKNTKQTPEHIEKRTAKIRGKKRTEEQVSALKQIQYERGLTNVTAVYDYHTKEKLGEFKSLGDACRFLGFNPEKYSNSAGRVALKTRNQYKGYVFEYVNRVVEKPIKLTKVRKSMKGREVLNIQTGIFYISAQEAYNTVELNITIGSFTRKLKGGRINDTSFIYV